MDGGKAKNELISFFTFPFPYTVNFDCNKLPVDQLVLGKSRKTKRKLALLLLFREQVCEFIRGELITLCITILFECTQHLEKE